MIVLSISSFESVTDSKEEIIKTIKNAYCPEKIVNDNPVLQIARLIIFPIINNFEIKRDKKFGGDLEYRDYEKLEKDYSAGKIHPLDLKNTIASYLDEIIAPIRKNWK